jgi:hypothetical protein
LNQLKADFTFPDINIGDGFMLKFFTGLTVLSLAMSSAALAFQPVATVSGVSGKVLVNHGQGFVALADATDLKVGDQVLVGAESHLMVTYHAKNCAVDISSPQTLTIGKVAPCEKGETVAALESTFVTPVNFEAGGGLLGGIGGPAIVGGVVAVTVIGGLAYYYTQNNDAPGCNAAVTVCP